MSILKSALRVRITIDNLKKKFFPTITSSCAKPIKTSHKSQVTHVTYLHTGQATHYATCCAPVQRYRYRHRYSNQISNKNSEANNHYPDTLFAGKFLVSL